MSRTGRVEIVAEVGVNHNGDLGLARELVEAAAASGADVVKFQVFDPALLVAPTAGLAPYQVRSSGREVSQREMLSGLTLPREGFRELADLARGCGMEFMATPFDDVSLKLLTGDLAVSRLKLGSGDLTNGPLLFAAAGTGLPLVLSTGMATLGEIESALALVAYAVCIGHPPDSLEQAIRLYAKPSSRERLASSVVLLQCTTAYPTPAGHVQLKAMDVLRTAFPVGVGFSDHTPGWAISLAAVARGTVLVEKHLTLNRGLPGPDHHASLEPEEFRSMTRGIRAVEDALGDGWKVPQEVEWENRRIARRGLVASRDLPAGHALQVGDLEAKRPEEGASPLLYFDMIGRRLRQAVRAEQPLTLEMVGPSGTDRGPGA